MKCITVNEKMADLLDETLSPNEKDEIMQHIDSCPECAQEFEAIRQLAAELTPKSEIHASENLKRNVMNQINNTSETIVQPKGRLLTLFSNRWIKVAGIAAMLLLAFALITLFKPQILNSQAYAAQTLIDKSVAALTDIKSMVMHFKVRAIPGDNFDILDTKGDFIEHSLWKTFTQPEKWKMEKPGLTVVMDGNKQYKYMEKAGIGYVGSPQAGFVDWMKIFLDPQLILQTEKDFSNKNKAEYKIQNTADETILTVKAKALGEFKNTYRLNGSIPESDNRRVYHFNKKTDRLTSVEIYILEKGQETEVLKVSEIQYDIEIPASTFAISLPAGVKWVELKDIEPKKENARLAANADEAARLWWESIAKQDWVTVFKLDPSLEHAKGIEEFKASYSGLKIIKMEKSFRSGIYPGTFVPYEIRLKSGEILSGKLAVRNDNPAKAWEIDGGF
jgi:hypothetical protein